MDGRTSRAACGVLAVLGLLATTMSPATATHLRPTVDEVERLADRIARSTAAQPPQGEVVVPAERRDPGAPGTRLRRAASSVGELLDRLPGGPGGAALARHLQAAREGVERSLGAYGTAPDIGSAFEGMAEAVRALQAAGSVLGDDDEALVDRMAAEVAVAARSVAVLVRPPRTTPLRGDAFVARADEHLAGGRYVAAVQELHRGASSFQSSITFSIEAFEQNLQSALAGETVGHAYSVSMNGTLASTGASGVARTHPDVPDEVASVPQGPAKEMYTASMSKTISAVALLHALREEGISVDSSISPYLPGNWMQEPSVAAISFRHLLAHQSGLPDGNTVASQQLDALETAIATGTAGILDFEKATYNNTNYALIRVLLPQVAIGDEVIGVYTNVLPEDEVYAALYADYVRANVLAPAGIDASCAPSEFVTIRTLGYLHGSPGTPGYDAGDWSLGCGATGWYLSALDLGSFLAHLRHTDLILDDDGRQLMDSGFLGWLNPVAFSSYVVGDWGEYRAHGGDSHQSNGVPGMTGCMMNFPNGAQATLLVNSRGGDLGGHACEALRDAYDDAWS